MAAGGGELAEIQAELSDIKKALRSDAGYLGMTGETLQRYLLQLNEKENLLLSRQIKHMSLEGTNGQNGSGVSALGGATPPQPKPPPSGAPNVFDKNKLAEVLVHMCDYEAVPQESTKALRALSALAYADAGTVGNNVPVIQQLLRLLAIHSGETVLTLAGIRALCNMAYDQDVALKRLTEPSVMTVLISAMARFPAPQEIGARASEAVARVVAAETHPDGETPASPNQVSGPSAISGLFLAAAGGGQDTLQGVMPRLVMQLVSNEVVEPVVVAARFAATGESAQTNAVLAVGWMILAKQLGMCEVPDLPQGLIDNGAIKVTSNLMERHVADGAVQLAGIEALSSLVGNRWAGLQAFANAGGMMRIEAALKAHGADSMLQTKGIRALASGVQWPEDVQEKSGYSSKRAVEHTKTAMTLHGDNAELQTAALEALAKYFDKPQCVTEMINGGGEGVVKAMIARHSDVEKVQHCGKLVLERITAASKAEQH